MKKYLIETSANEIYLVEECSDVNQAHVWRGFKQKRVKGGYVNAKNARMELVRKEASKVLGEFLA